MFYILVRLSYRDEILFLPRIAKLFSFAVRTKSMFSWDFMAPGRAAIIAGGSFTAFQNGSDLFRTGTVPSAPVLPNAEIHSISDKAEDLDGRIQSRHQSSHQIKPKGPRGTCEAAPAFAYWHQIEQGRLCLLEGSSHWCGRLARSFWWQIAGVALYRRAKRLPAAKSPCDTSLCRTTLSRVLYSGMDVILDIVVQSQHM